MKKKFVVINTVIIGMLLSSCKMSIYPDLLSIEFIDDRTIEYEFAFVIGENASARYYSSIQILLAFISCPFVISNRIL